LGILAESYRRFSAGFWGAVPAERDPGISDGFEKKGIIPFFRYNLVNLRREGDNIPSFFRYKCHFEFFYTN